MNAYAFFHGEDHTYDNVNEAIEALEQIVTPGETLHISCEGQHAATVSADDAGTVADKHCCVRARQGDWEERAGGALHCPVCGDKLARFKQ